MDELFEAKIALVGAFSPHLLEDFALHFQVLRDRLDDQIYLFKRIAEISRKAL